MLVVDDIEKPHEVLVMKKYYLYNSLQKSMREDRMGWRGESWDGKNLQPQPLLTTSSVKDRGGTK